jgi:type I restriction enzyme S subunit
VWVIDRIKDHARKIGSGITPSGGAASYLESGVPLLRSQNVHFDGLRLDDVAFIAEDTHAEMASTQLLTGDVLLNITGASIGRCTFVPEGFGEGNVNQHVCIIRPSSRIDYRFLTYCLSAPWGQDQIFSSFWGASRQGLGQRDLGQIQVPVPPLPEQERIATYLDASCAAIDAAVAAKRHQIETLDALRKETVTRAITRGLKPSTRTKPSGDDWLGEIPTHWSAPCLKRLLREPLTYGLNEAAELEERDLPRYLRITDFDADGNLREDTFRSLSREIAREALLEPNDVLFARSGATVGKTFLFRNYDGEACFAGYLIRARTLLWKLDPLFLYLFTKSTAYESWKNLIFTRATIQNISAVKYNYLAIPLPPLDEQRAIVAHVEEKSAEFRSLTDCIESQIAILTAYRKSLIHECVTGQRRITEADVTRSKLSENSGQLDHEPYENIGRLKTAGGESPPCFAGQTNAGRRCQP